MDSVQSGWVPGRFRLTKATPANDGKTEQLTEGVVCRVSCFFNSVRGWSLKILCYLSLFFFAQHPKNGSRKRDIFKEYSGVTSRIKFLLLPCAPREARARDLGETLMISLAQKKNDFPLCRRLVPYLW